MSAFLQKVGVRRSISLLALLLAWEALSRQGMINPFYAPPPS